MESPSVATLKQSRRGGLIQRDDPGYVDPWTRCRLVRENFSGISFGPLALREMLCYISDGLRDARQMAANTASKMLRKLRFSAA